MVGYGYLTILTNNRLTILKMVQMVIKPLFINKTLDLMKKR